MIYLDYSATTPVNENVLDTYVKVTKDYIGNPNSLHELGVKAKKLIDASTNQIASILGVKASEIIYTSGASESNNMAIKGICLKYKNIVLTSAFVAYSIQAFANINVIQVVPIYFIIIGLILSQTKELTN